MRRQSEHFDDYRRALGRSTTRGLLYPCFCSRRRCRGRGACGSATAAAWPRDPDGAPLYPGTCRGLRPRRRRRRLAAGGRPHALRLDTTAALASAAAARLSAPVGDGGNDVDRRPAGAVGRCRDRPRKDIPTSYHLAVVLDDALQGVTHVVRGARSRGGDRPPRPAAGAARAADAALPSPCRSSRTRPARSSRRAAARRASPTCGRRGVTAAERPGSPRLCCLSRDAQHLKPDERSVPRASAVDRATELEAMATPSP